MDDSLINVASMSKAEFGKALLDSANERRQKNRFEQSLQAAENIAAGLENCERQIEWFELLRTKYRKQRDALENGAFDFNRDGFIVYIDDTLNK